jgi:hypothetical protein
MFWKTIFDRLDFFALENRIPKIRICKHQGEFVQDFFIHHKHPQKPRNLVARGLVILLLIGMDSHALPLNLGGVYTAEAEITTETDGRTKVVPSLKLSLKLELTDLDGILKGNLTATTRNSFVPLTFVFEFNGKLSNSLMRLKVNVGICLEYPSMTLEAKINADGTIEISPSSQVVKCNFERVRISLLRRVFFVHEIKK